MTFSGQVKSDQIRNIMQDFYDRIFDDVMIGFLFHGKDKERLIEKETEFTLRIFGEGIDYTGKGMRAAHAKVPILGGHFERRMQILRDVLEDHSFPETLKRHWIGHAENLRSVITADPDSKCNHERVMEKINKIH